MYYPNRTIVHILMFYPIIMLRQTVSKAEESMMSSQFDVMASSSFTELHSSSSSSFREDSVDHNKQGEPVSELKQLAESPTGGVSENKEDTLTVDSVKDSVSPGLPQEGSLSVTESERTSSETSLTKGKPPPIVTGIPTVSSISSIDSPQSPFFIPRNPFLSLVGKMPKFQWSLLHLNLLEDLLKSLKAIIDHWKQ